MFSNLEIASRPTSTLSGPYLRTHSNEHHNFLLENWHKKQAATRTWSVFFQRQSGHTQKLSHWSREADYRWSLLPSLHTSISSTNTPWIEIDCKYCKRSSHRQPSVTRTNMFLSSVRWKYCVQDKFLFFAFELHLDLTFMNYFKHPRNRYIECFCYLTASLASFEIPSFCMHIFKLCASFRSYDQRTILWQTSNPYWEMLVNQGYITCIGGWTYLFLPRDFSRLFSGRNRAAITAPVMKNRREKGMTRERNGKLHQRKQKQQKEETRTRTHGIGPRPLHTTFYLPLFWIRSKNFGLDSWSYTGNSSKFSPQSTIMFFCELMHTVIGKNK